MADDRIFQGALYKNQLCGACGMTFDAPTFRAAHDCVAEPEEKRAACAALQEAAPTLSKMALAIVDPHHPQVRAAARAHRAALAAYTAIKLRLAAAEAL